MNPRSTFAAAATASLALLAPAAAQEPVVDHTTKTKTTTTKKNTTNSPNVETGTSTELSKVEINFDELAGLGTEVFQIASNATADNGELTFNSQLTLRTTIRDGRVELSDTWRIMGRTCHTIMTCRPDSILSLKECSVDMAAQGKSATGKVVVVDNDASGEIAGRQVTFSYPDGTVNLAAILRIVTQLPNNAGTSYTFSNYSEAIELRAQEPAPNQTFSLTCHGTESVETDQGRVPCTKFTLNVAKPVELFVDARTQRLQRVVADQGQTIMIRQADTATATVDPSVERTSDE